MKCPICQKQLPNESKICGFCGANLDLIKADESIIKKESSDEIKSLKSQDMDLIKPLPQIIDKKEPEIPKDIEKSQVLNATAIIYKKEVKATADTPQNIFKKYKPMSTASFFFMDILLKIPVLNIILLLVWSFNKNVNKNRIAYARSKLVWGAVYLLTIIGFIILIACILSTKPDFVEICKNFYNYILNFFATEPA